MQSSIRCAIVVCCFLTGCVSTYKQEVLTALTAKLANGKSIVIATPTNGSYGAQEYVGSGKSTANAVRAAFARHSNTITVSSDCKDLNCLKNSQTHRYGYYVVPQILHWEDRATEWSGKKDKIEIKISVYDGNDWNELSSSILSGKSKWLTFGGDHPQDLLPKPLNDYVNSLY